MLLSFDSASSKILDREFFQAIRINVPKQFCRITKNILENFLLPFDSANLKILRLQICTITVLVLTNAQHSRYVRTNGTYAPVLFHPREAQAKGENMKKTDSYIRWFWCSGPPERDPLDSCDNPSRGTDSRQRKDRHSWWHLHWTCPHTSCRNHWRNYTQNIQCSMLMLKIKALKM